MANFSRVFVIGVSMTDFKRCDTEIKELAQGLLRYKTDSMSTVSVEWVDVLRLVSKLTFQVETDDIVVHEILDGVWHSPLFDVVVTGI